MNLPQFMRIPYAEDKVFGFLLLIYIVCSFAIISVFSEPIDSPRMFFWSLLLGLGILFWVKNGERKIFLPKTILILLGGIAVWAFVATIFSLDRVNSVVGINIRMTSSLWFFTAWTATISLLGTLSKDKLIALLKVASYIVGAISVWAICQYYGLGYYAGMDPGVRPLVPSFMGNANFGAMFVATGLFINAWYIFHSKKYVRLLHIFFVACHIAALMIFASRGALLGALAGFVVVLFGLAIKKQWKPLLVSLITVLVLASSNVLFLSAIRAQTSDSLNNDQSASQRWYAWDNAFTNIAHSPLTGTGLGNYFIAYRQNHESYLSNMNWFDDPHNVYLHLAVNGGMPLALLILMLLAVTLWKLIRPLFNPSQELRYINLFLAASISAWSVAALFNPVSLSNWILLALLLSASLYTEVSPQQFPARLSNVGGAVLGVLLVVMGSAFLASEVFLWQATQFSQKSQYAVSEPLAKISVYLNPTNLVALNQLAMSEYFNKKYDQALHTLLFTENLHPLSAGVYQQTLTGHMNLYQATQEEQYKQQVYESMNLYRAAYQNHQFIHQNLANLYYTLGDYDMAMKEAKQWVVLSQGNFSAWLFLSSVYQVMDRPDLQEKARYSAFRAAPSKELQVTAPQK